MDQEFKAKDAPTFRALKSSTSCDEGDVVKVRMITDGEIYFYDCNRRWCYWLKSEEGTEWEWVKKPATNP